MAAPNEKLAASLTALQELQKGGRRVFRSEDLSRIDRERLLQNGFLQEVMRGWLISSSPSARAGRQHAVVRLILGILRALLPGAFRRRVASVAGTVAFAPWREHGHPDPGGGQQPEGHQQQDRPCSSARPLRPEGARRCRRRRTSTVRDGLRLFASGGRVGEGVGSFLHPQSDRDAGCAREHRATPRSPAAAARRRPLGGSRAGSPERSAASAGRRWRTRSSRDEKRRATMCARAIRSTRGRHSGSLPAAATAHRRTHAGDVGVDARRASWRSFPKRPDLPKDREAYLRFVDEIYRAMPTIRCRSRDTRVTPELIERVRAGNWDPDHHDDDRQSRDALAARGYWQAFQAVKAKRRRNHRAAAMPATLVARHAPRSGIANCSSPASRRV